MKNQEIAKEIQIQQWTLAGPLLMTGTLLVLLLTPIRPLAIAFIALIGLPICWKWKLRGAATAVTLLTAVVGYQIAFYSEDRTLWYAGIALTIALTLSITALCSQEVEGLFANLSDLAQPTTKKTQPVANELSTFTQKRIEELKSAEASISGLQLHLNEKKEELKQIYLKITEDKELSQKVQMQNDSLQRDLSQSQNEISLLQAHTQQLNENLQKLQSEILLLSEKNEVLQNNGNKVAELEKFRLEEQKTSLANITALEQELIEKRELLLSKDLLIEEANKNVKRLESQNAGLLQEIFQRRHECTLLKQHSEELSERFQAQLEEATNSVSDKQLRKAEGLYKQLKEQFAEKGRLLDSTRQELFLAQEELLKLQREREENEVESKQADFIAAMEKQLQKTTDELAFLEKRYHDEVESLQEIIKSLSASETAIIAEPESTPIKSKPAAKTRTPKKTKTTNWANTILSRCADSAPE